MAEHDLHSQTKGFVAFETQVHTTTGAENGEVIDTDGFESIEFFILSGVITTGDFAITLQSDSVVGFSSPTAIPAALTLGALPAYTEDTPTDDNLLTRVGTVVKEQFVRLVITGSDTPNGTFSAVAVLSNPKTLPVPDQST